MTNAPAGTAPARLLLWMDRVIEGAWLAAVGLLPLFFLSFVLRAFYLPKAMLLQLIALVLLGAVVSRRLLQPEGLTLSGLRSMSRDPVLAALLAFGLIVVLSTVFSISPWMSISGSVERRQGTITILSWVVVCLVLATHLRTRAQLKRLIITVLLSSGLVAFIGISEHYIPAVSSRFLGTIYTPRVSSTTGNALSLSAYLAMAMPFTIASGILVFLRQTEFQRSYLYLWLLAALFILQLWCLVLSVYSYVLLLYLVPTALLMALLGLLVMRRRGLTIAALVVFLALIIAGTAIVVPQWQNAVRGTAPREALISTASGTPERLPSTLYGRARYWVYSMQVLPQAVSHPQPTDAVPVLRPLIGYGPETYLLVTQKYQPPERLSMETQAASMRDRPHNHYLYLAITNGVLGLLAWLAVLAGFVFLIARLCRRAGPLSPLSLYGLAAASTLAGFMAHAIFNPIAITEESLFWMCLALAPALVRLHGTSDSIRHPRRIPATDTAGMPTVSMFRIVLACVLVGATVVGGLVAVRNPLQAEYALLQGVRLSGVGHPNAVFSYAQATELQPGESTYWGALGGYAHRVALDSPEESKGTILELSIIALERARDNQPLLTFWHYQLGDAQLYAHSTIDMMPVGAAMDSYGRALELSPRNAVVAGRMAVAYMVSEDWDAAAMALNQASEYDPAWTRTEHLRIALTALTGDGDAAADALLERLYQNPGELRTFAEVAAAQLRTFGLLDEVVAGMEPRIEVQGGQAVPLALRGVLVAITGGDVAQAADLLVRAVDAAEEEDHVRALGTVMQYLIELVPGLEDALVARLGP